MRVIAICGAKRSGKDTISNILGQLYGFTNVKISEDLKNCCKILFGFEYDQLEGQLKDVVDPTLNCKPRELMQFIGTDVMQFHIQKIIPDIGRTFWIKKTIERIEKQGIENVVISDLRFLHEYELLKQTYGSNLFAWKVERPSLSVNSSESNHCSEQEWKILPCDKYILNLESLTIKDLVEVVKNNYSLTKF